MKVSKANFALGMTATAIGLVAVIYFLNTPTHTNSGESRVGTDIESLANNSTVTAAESSTERGEDNKNIASSSNAKAFYALARRTAPRQLPTESKFISNNAISLKASEMALLDKKFPGVVESMARESATDINAQDIQNLYEAQIVKSVKEFKGLHLAQLACGLSICIGSLRGNSSTYEDWVSGVIDSGRVPTYSYTATSIALAPEDAENRFIFSVDSDINSMISPQQH